MRRRAAAASGRDALPRPNGARSRLRLVEGRGVQGRPEAGGGRARGSRPPRYGPHPSDGEVPPHRRRSAPSGAMGRHERGRAASHPSRLRPVAAHPPRAPRRRRRRLPPRLRRLQHRLSHAIPVVQSRAHGRSYRALRRTDPRRSQAGTRRRQDGLRQARMEAVGRADPRRSPRARARRGAAAPRPQAAHGRSRARYVGAGARRGPGRRRRARLASAVHRRGHRPEVGAGADTAGRRSSCGTAALGSVPPLGHSRRPSGAGPSRPHAARPSQARREARPQTCSPTGPGYRGRTYRA